MALSLIGAAAIAFWAYKLSFLTGLEVQPSRLNEIEMTFLTRMGTIGTGAISRMASTSSAQCAKPEKKVFG